MKIVLNGSQSIKFTEKYPNLVGLYEGKLLTLVDGLAILTIPLPDGRYVNIHGKSSNNKNYIEAEDFEDFHIDRIIFKGKGDEYVLKIQDLNIQDWMREVSNSFNNELLLYFKGEAHLDF